jgi:negative regulator of genetic competence, sporulation and motility
MNKYIVWSDSEYFDEIMDRKRNLESADNARFAAELYTSEENEKGSIIYVIDIEKAKDIIDQIKNDGFFTKEMEDEIFSNSEKFYVGYGDFLLSDLR